jgi:hypothetical protein
MRNDYGIRSDVRFSKGGKVIKKNKSSKKMMGSIKKLDNKKLTRKNNIVKNTKSNE